MRTFVKPLVYAALVFGLVHCAQSSFSGKSGAAQDRSGTPGGGSPAGGSPGGAPGGPAGGGTGGPNTSAVTLPVGTQKPAVTDGGAAPTHCVIADPTIANVDPTTCLVTGLKPGNTTVTATMPNGTTESIPVTVTPNSLASGNPGSPGSPGSAGSPGSPGSQPTTGLTADGTSIPLPPGGVVSADGVITQVSGNLCLGGPACNVSFLMASQADANTCMQTANAAPCNNDPSCTQADMIRVCNCTCTSSTGLSFGTPGACLRTNPLQPNALPRLAECTKN